MFAERLLREARAQASGGTVDPSPSIAGLPVASSVTASDSFPFITASGNGYRGTASLIRDYALGISGGTATIPENLTVGGNTTLWGDVTFAGPWQHPDVIAGTFTIAAGYNGALLGPVGVSGTIDVAGTLAILA